MKPVKLLPQFHGFRRFFGGMMPASRDGPRLLIPRNLAFTWWPTNQAKHAEEALWIIHCLFAPVIIGSESSPLEWRSLSRKRLEEVVDTRRTTIWLRFLQETQVIERRNQPYIKGVQSFQYRLGRKFRHEKAQIHMIRDTQLAEKVTTQRLSRQEDRNLDPVFYELEKQLGKLRIRSRDAMDYVRLKKVYADKKSPEDSREYDESTIQLFNEFKHFSVDRYGRAHSNLTRLARDLRPYLYLKRKQDVKLSHVDIKNSQPFVLGILLNELRTLDEEGQQNLSRTMLRFLEAERLEADLEAAGGDQGENQEPTQHHELHFVEHTPVNLQSIPYTPPRAEAVIADVLYAVETAKLNWVECAKYIKCCETGQFYESLVEKMPETSIWRSCPRTELKRNVFKETIFCISENAPDREIRDAFVSAYPCVWRIVCRLKRADHSLLPKLMQHMESEYVIKIAAKSFIEKHPGRFIATIHDSLVVESEFRQEAMSALWEAFDGSGLHPSLDAPESVTLYS